MPGLLVLPDRYVPAYAPDRPLSRGGQLLPGYDGLTQAFDTDAHATLYRPLEVEGLMPRLSKKLLKAGLLRDDQVQCEWIAIDVDLEGEWTTETIEAAKAKCLALPYPLNQFVYWHTTEGGYHVWYELAVPLTASALELHARALRQGLLDHGVEADEACKDWTRLIRLPRVKKESGTITHTSPWFSEGWGVGDDGQALKLDPATLKPWMGEAPTHSVALDRLPSVTSTVQLERTPLECEAMVFHHGDRDEPTEIGKVLIKTIQNSLMSAGNHTIAAESVLDGDPFPEGMRDTSVVNTVGWLVRKARSVADQGVTHEHLVGLMVGPCRATDEHSGPQDSGASWLDKAVDKVLEYWKADEEEAARKQAEAVRASLQLTTPEELAEVLRAQTQDELLDSRVNEEWFNRLKTYTILRGRSEYYCIEPNGHYAGPFPEALMCVGQLQRNGMADLLGMRWIDGETGKTKKVSQATIAEDYSKPFEMAGIEFHPLSVPKEHRCYLESSDSHVARLRVRRFRPSHMDAQRSDWADQFLRRICGSTLTEPNQQYRMLVYWLCHFRDFDGSQLPLLYIYGAPRTGKTLLTKALSMHAPTVYPTDAGGTYNTHYGQGLVLVYDDLEPVSYGNYQQLRRAVGEFLNVLAGQRVGISRKFHDPTSVQLPWRAVMVNNSPEFFTNMMEAFKGVEGLDKRRALAMRTVLLKTNPHTRQWILDTSKDRGDIALELARHITWMNANRSEYREHFKQFESSVEPGGMRLVDSKETQMLVESGISSDEMFYVGEAVRRIHGAVQSPNAKFAAFHEDGTVCVIRAELAQLMMNESKDSSKARYWINRALDAILLTRGAGPTHLRAVRPEEDVWVRDHGKSHKRRWKQLDIGTLIALEPDLPVNTDGKVQDIYEMSERLRNCGLFT